MEQRSWAASNQPGVNVLIADADDSYDFSHLPRFLNALNGGADLIMGNRLKGGIRPSAMPFLYRYLGNPVLSFLARLFFSSPVDDFHCGIRAFREIGDSKTRSPKDRNGIRRQNGRKVQPYGA
jgi:hypothetical protein